jgi:hypothetical protein
MTDHKERNEYADTHVTCHLYTYCSRIIGTGEGAGCICTSVIMLWQGTVIIMSPRSPAWHWPLRLEVQERELVRYKVTREET